MYAKIIAVIIVIITIIILDIQFETVDVMRYAQCYIM